MTLWPRCEGPGDLTAIEAVPLAARPLPESTYDALRRTATEAPQAVAIAALPDGASWQSPVELTYAELFAKVTSFANVLTAAGVARGDAVGLLSPNVIGLIPALLAAEAVGIAVPVNPGLDRDTIGALLRRAGVRVLVAAGPDVDPRLWELAQQLGKELELDGVFALAATEQTRRRPPTATAYLDDLAGAPVRDRLLGGEPGADDLAAFFHTGGTTGTPKLAAHTHRMQVVDAWSIATISDLTAGSSVFAALPLFHVNALVVTTLVPVLRGMRGVWAGPLGYRDVELIRNFWRIVDRYTIASMSAVPSVYDTLSRLPIDADISSLRLPIVGAAPLPTAVRTAWEEHGGVPLCEGYGLTEATCATARSFPGGQRSDSVGQRLPYQQVAAITEDPSNGAWTFLPAGVSGRLVVSGPTVFPGYVVGRDDEGPVLDATGKVVDGWLDTGDLGSVSADGFVTLTGRVKDLIIRSGHNIDPAEIEDVLRRHPGVLDAGVVGRPDEYAGEVPVAFVTTTDAAVDADEIASWAADRVPERPAAPKSVTILPALPQTAIGKPYKVALRVLAAQQALGPRLSALGIVLSDDTWCEEHEGHVRVTIPSPDSAAQRDAVSTLLNRYAIAWSFR